MDFLYLHNGQPSHFHSLPMEADTSFNFEIDVVFLAGAVLINETVFSQFALKFCVSAHDYSLTIIFNHDF